MILFKEDLGWVVKDTSTNGTFYHVKKACEFGRVLYEETTPVALNIAREKEFTLRMRENFTLTYVDDVGQQN